MLLRKNKKIIILGICVLACILMAFIGGQTYAKYMANVQGKGTADVANWSFKVNDKDEKIQTISLNTTINNKTIKFIQPLYEPQDVGTDDSGIYEIVIEMAVIFEKKKEGE